MDFNKIGKLFFEKEWEDIPIKVHNECVIQSCLNMIKNTNLDKEIFIIAGWIHDLGRKEDIENHPTISLKYLEKFILENKEIEQKKELIMDCILNHRNSGNPKTIYGKIFKTADKVSFHTDKWIASNLKIS